MGSPTHPVAYWLATSHLLRCHSPCHVSDAMSQNPATVWTIMMNVYLSDVTEVNASPRVAHPMSYHTNVKHYGLERYWLSYMIPLAPNSRILNSQRYIRGVNKPEATHFRSCISAVQCREHVVLKVQAFFRANYFRFIPLPTLLMSLCIRRPLNTSEIALVGYLFAPLVGHQSTIDW